MTKKGHKKFWA